MVCVQCSGCAVQWVYSAVWVVQYSTVPAVGVHQCSGVCAVQCVYSAVCVQCSVGSTVQYSTVPFTGEVVR